MNKKTLILLWKLNSLYESIWNEWVLTKKDSFEFDECVNKMKLVNKIKKNIEEQERGFLKSKIKYSKWWEYLLENIQNEYSKVHNGISGVLLDM